jgi:hypothetical protein
MKGPHFPDGETRREVRRESDLIGRSACLAFNNRVRRARRPIDYGPDGRDLRPA